SASRNSPAPPPSADTPNFPGRFAAPGRIARPAPWSVRCPVARRARFPVPVVPLPRALSAPPDRPGGPPSRDVTPCIPPSGRARAPGPPPSLRALILLYGERVTRATEHIIISLHAPPKTPTHAAHGRGAALVDLERQQATGFKQCARTCEQRAGCVQTIHAAHQRFARLEIADGRIQLLIFGRTDIRGIRHDRAKPLSLVHQRREQGPFANLDRRLRRYALHILTRQ